MGPPVAAAGVGVAGHRAARGHGRGATRDGPAPGRSSLRRPEADRVTSPRNPATRAQIGEAEVAAAIGAERVAAVGRRPEVAAREPVELLDLAGRPGPAPLAVYPDLVRSNTNRPGFLQGGRLARVLCSTEEHVFETATGRAFTVLQLDDETAAAVESADGHELVTVTSEGRLQRWPLAPLAVAREQVVGERSAGEFARFRAGSPAAMRAAERRYLSANPTPLHWARLGEMALAEGDLADAITCYQRAAELGPLRPTHVITKVYPRLGELVCRRLGRGDGDAARVDADRRTALEALAQWQRCGACPASPSSSAGRRRAAPAKRAASSGPTATVRVSRCSASPTAC